MIKIWFASTKPKQQLIFDGADDISRFDANSLSRWPCRLFAEILFDQVNLTAISIAFSYSILFRWIEFDSHASFQSFQTTDRWQTYRNHPKTGQWCNKIIRGETEIGWPANENQRIAIQSEEGPREYTRLCAHTVHGLRKELWTHGREEIPARIQGVSRVHGWRGQFLSRYEGLFENQHQTAGQTGEHTAVVAPRIGNLLSIAERYAQSGTIAVGFVDTVRPVFNDASGVSEACNRPVKWALLIYCLSLIQVHVSTEVTHTSFLDVAATQRVCRSQPSG